MKRILFPTDFSTAATNAFDYTLALVEDMDAVIDLLHIYSISISDISVLSAELIQQQMDDEAARVKRQFEAFTRGKDSSKVNQIIDLYGLFPETEIAEIAEKEKYNYIIMGTKGGTNRLDDLMGSITTKVMMKAPCPVIAVPMEAKFSEIEHIAYATTLDPTDTQVVAQLTAFADDLGALVHYVNVNTKSNEGTKKSHVEIQDFPMQYADYTVVNNYSVINGLNEYVTNNKIDLLAMYVPHRRLWERIFHTSVSKRMALHSKVPLMVFHQ